MKTGYPFQDIEPKWQAYWQKHSTFRAIDGDSRPKFYVLDMFPYPSGAGLHVGHPEGYTASDIVARFRRMRGENVLHPMGWDAFGLPAEQYAMETGTHPAETTKRNIKIFTRQIRRLGFAYDWDREINTTDPGYVKWTQWIFLQIYRKGLAYTAEVPVWWCPECGTVLANEEVVDGKCERKGHPVTRRPMRQWMLKITAYADRLLEDLESLQWPEHIKSMQRHWIGRSEGTQVDFLVKTIATPQSISTSPGKGLKPIIPAFTTRPDTLFGATYLVLAPEHILVPDITTEDQQIEVKAYCRNVSRKSDMERTELSKDKTGVFTGAYAINPVNNEQIQIWIADYVLASYGTGAIMAVPAHDQRDFEFAKKYSLPIRTVIVPENERLFEPLDMAFEEPGRMQDSGAFSGMRSVEAKSKITTWLTKNHLGVAKVNYKLRDWLFSRQRYWGEPIPIIHCASCGPQPVPEKDLPLLLPEVEDFKPSGTGEPPLARAIDWVKTTCPSCKGPGQRETNTMPQWAGSCWYYLRYLDPQNDKRAFDPKKERYWMPVDLYIGGAEHAVLHLLYARFWHKVLHDCGLVSQSEPFQRLVNQGLILGEDNEKMSKSRGNVINPDDIIQKHGADAFRLYEMFMGPLEAIKPWNTRSIEGTDRFLNRIWRLLTGDALSDAPLEGELNRLVHHTTKTVTGDIESLHLNTAISAMMILLNAMERAKPLPRRAAETLLLLLAPFAPHMAEELWQRLGHKESLVQGPWPLVDDAALVQDEFVWIVQVNGKVRARLALPAMAGEAEIKTAVLGDTRVQKFIDHQSIRQFIIVPKRLVNIVV